MPIRGNIFFGLTTPSYFLKDLKCCLFYMWPTTYSPEEMNYESINNRGKEVSIRKGPTYMVKLDEGTEVEERSNRVHMR